MMTAAENIPPSLLPKKLKNKKCANFSSWRDFGYLSYLLLCACFFVNSRLEPPPPYQWKKTKQNFYGRTRGQKTKQTFMAALAVKNKTNPDPRAYLFIIAVIIS